MLKNVKEFYSPPKIADAVKLLSKYKEKAAIVAGGTSLTIRPPKNISTVISLRKLNLKYIKISTKNVVIGAMTTLGEIINAKKIKDPVGLALKDASSLAATTPIRNLITVGGNITQVYSWSNLPLLAIAAKMLIHVEGKKKSVIAAKDFFKKHPKQILGKDEIVTALEYRLSKKGEKIFAAFNKFSLTQTDYPILNAAIVITVKDKKIIDAGVVAGAVSALPQSLTKAEQFLIGKDIKDLKQHVDEFGKIVFDEINPKQDMRVSIEYKKEISKPVFERTLENLLQ